MLSLLYTETQRDKVKLSLYLIPHQTMKTEQQMYRVIQEERSVFWEVIVRKKDHMNMHLILNGYRDRVV